LIVGKEYFYAIDFSLEKEIDVISTQLYKIVL